MIHKPLYLIKINRILILFFLMSSCVSEAEQRDFNKYISERMSKQIVRKIKIVSTLNKCTDGEFIKSEINRDIVKRISFNSTSLKNMEFFVFLEDVGDFPIMIHYNNGQITTLKIHDQFLLD